MLSAHRPDAVTDRWAWPGFGDPGERCDVDHFAAGLGSTSGGHAGSFGRGGAAGPTGQGRPQGLAALGEGGVDHGEDLFAGWPWSPGGSRRVKATSPEWILGAGQKTFMPITPALRMLLYQAALTEGTP